MKFTKHILAAVMAASAMPASAGLTVLEKTPEKPPIPPLKVVEEGTRARAEIERLNGEIRQLKAELGTAKAELTSAKESELACNTELAQFRHGLNQIERQIEETGRAQSLVHFTPNSAKVELTPEVGETLVGAGRRATRIVVRGYTDNSGTSRANRAMAFARAQAVKKYLVDRDVTKHKITVISRGSTDPVGDNGTEEGRSQNRRVSIEFIR